MRKRRGPVDLRGKSVLVFGLARSGAGAANLLSKCGADVTVTDRKPEGELGEYIRGLSPTVKRCLGGHPGSLNGTDMVVVSPGIPLSIEPLVRAREQGIKIIGELELAYRIASSRLSEMSGGETKFLAITGTNGKSTTTTLLDLMLEKAGFNTIFGGNIGHALTEEIFKQVKAKAEVEEKENLKLDLDLNLNLDFVVAEVSSFQLESIDEFRPFGATILNITPDHLDRYHSMAEYVDAKCRIFLNQGAGDFLLLNDDDPGMTKIINRKLELRSVRPRIYFFSRQKEIQGVYFKNGVVYYNIPEISFRTSHFPLIKADAIRIKGVHNLENAMASAAMALLAGCPPNAVVEALREFPGLEHRLEFVRELEGARYVNDSKGTNVGAVVKSIEGFSEPVILIAGGRDKEGDFARLRPLIREKVKALILIGEAAGKMESILGDLTRTVLCSDLKEAVENARGLANRGDAVLLSPACASFDMFKDFEDRGRQFKKIVMELA